MGVVPREHSTGSQQKPLGISKLMNSSLINAALKSFAEERKSCQMKAIVRSGLV
jgi:hypothetical protein